MGVKYDNVNNRVSVEYQSHSVIISCSNSLQRSNTVIFNKREAHIGAEFMWSEVRGSFR